MVSQANRSMSSALEVAAMDLESTSKSSEEPVTTSQSTTSHQNGSGASSSASTNQIGDPMSDYVESTSQDSSEKSSSNVSAVYGNYDDYQLLPDAPWPPPVFIRQDITPQERYYIEHRWYSQWSFFDTKATQNKNRYYRTQLIVGIGSVSVPVLVGINATGLAAQILYFVTVFISLSVAMATAIESLYTFGDNWRSYRSAAEDMRQEKSLYDVKAGRYANNKQAFIRFVERCEEIIAQQNGRWVQSQEKAAEQIAEDADTLLDRDKDVTDQFGNHITSTRSATTTPAYVEPAAPAPATYAETTPPATETYTETPPVAETTETTDTYEGMDTQDPSAPTSYG